ncbi:nucleoside-diphosphate sugar epimerase/dehydratase [Nitrosovibrio sp. Nv17]|jgi:FlaA1/EpsC-like NDP-sugar epimerase|uniref:polysaccharide biosynthesis protein n=1 Tax=Nitrosovibrio sp. Nv17 TaxID=1855339 RepID=UPI0009086AE9|nr:nucleoside-diphosphate sugar epimerase/dehydratase [Nitrosovibrio sp. Nv17]SFW17869.1 NDP-sugar epimerase, includes UDP-GlcNAc-inverting 4,6-dehydratase FlaA1 and capsular polysaccharide biosynthesis protein EpsC [Nitrosovibrio sp. Nv17]
MTRSRLGMPNIRTVIAFVHDIAAAAAAWALAYTFRFNFDIPPLYQQSLFRTLPWILPVHAVAFLRFGLYRGLWHYASLPDLRRILLAVLTAATAVPMMLLLLQIHRDIPRTVLLLAPILLLFIMGGSRLAYRLWKEHRLYGPKKTQGNLVLVLGANDGAISLVKELSRSTQWCVAGLLDDDPRKRGLILHGSKVLGGISDLPALARELDVAHAIIALPSGPDRRHARRTRGGDRRHPDRLHRDRRRALEVCSSAGVKALIAPSYDDLISGKVTVSQIRNVELEDLLKRDLVVLDDDKLNDLLARKTVLVTGAGGSIGSELCRQIARFEPRRLILFELNEFALYKAEQEFRAHFPDLSMVFLIGDIKDRHRVSQALSRYRPALVFHAAAYKHVPLMEQENAWQAILNNAWGTYVLGQAAIEHGVDKFVLISTDKAVNPTNVMGASKRLAEMICQALQQLARQGRPEGQVRHTCFVMVRFGNVLGSTGSVIPKFREQIAKGGPVTVTHSEVTRYFMSIPEAAQLVLQAGLMGGREGGGEVFVLDMGEPIRIADLARDMIRLSGLDEEDVKIVYNGLRPGEKLYEQPLAEDEDTLPTPHAKLRIAQPRQADAQWLGQLVEWMDRHPVLDDRTVREELAQWVPEYRPQANDAVPPEHGINQTKA